jgi:peroxiredoxin
MTDAAYLPHRPDRRHALAGLGLLLAGATPWAQAAAPAVGDTIEWPTLGLIDGSTLTPQDLQGKAAVVVFWATWCAFCRRHNAHVDRLHREHGHRDLRILGVAIDSDAATVRRHLQTHGYAFPVVAGMPELRQRFTTRQVVPLTCVVDRRGRLRQAIPGEMSEADVLGLAAFATADGPRHASLRTNGTAHG